MKRLVFLFLTMCSFTLSYSQTAKELLTEEEKQITEKTKDDAFLAPTSKFVGKKWYSDQETYYIFNQNGTGAMVQEFVDNDYSHQFKSLRKYPFRWKRDGIDLYVKYNMMNQTVIQPIESSLSQLSPREKAEVKKDYVRWQTKVRDKKYTDTEVWYNYEIYILTNDIFMSTFGDNDSYWVTKKKLDELKNRKNKIEEQKKAEEEAKQKAEEEAKQKTEEEAKQKAAEEAILKEEASALNKKAYELAKEEKYEDAIATIDKAIEKRPNDPNYYDSKGEILLMKGDKSGAKEMWSKVISLDKEFAQYRSNLYKGLFENWKTLTPDFDKSLPFRIIKVKNAKSISGTYCCVFFSTTPNDDSKKDTKYNINFYTGTIGDNQDQGARYNKEISSCQRLEGDWYVYQFSTDVYFCSIQKNALNCEVQVLIQ